MTIKPVLLLICILAAAFIACNRATPAGFWQNFKEDLLVKNISDQGPYGGHRAVYWRSDKEQSFNSNETIKFAKMHGWTFVDSSSYDGTQTSKWMYQDQAVFPLTSTGFFDTVMNNSQLSYFPRWFDGHVEVYKFKTGWVTIEPGTDNAIEENGFVVINSDCKQMAVYHLWGE
jgi:hypothetical protein